jgi:WD40 repeat protein
MTSTPPDKPTLTITPASVNKPEVHPLALNEQNAQIKVKKLATFGEQNICLISPELNNAVGMRVINGKTQYLLAVEKREAGIQIWDLEAKKIIQTLKSEGIWFPDSLIFHPDQQKLISITRHEFATSTTPDQPASLKLWDIQSGTLFREFKFAENRSDPIKVSPDGLNLALFTTYGEENWKVSELNLQTSEVIDMDYDFPLFWDTVPPYVYTSKNDLLSITYGRDEKLHLLNLSKNFDTELQFPFASLDEVDHAEAIISTMAINSDGSYIAGGAKNGYIYIWDATNGNLIQTIAAHEISRSDGWLGGIKILEFSPETNLLVSVGYNGFTKLWNAKTGTLLQKLNVCYFGGFTPDGRYLVTIDKVGIQLWGIP